MMGKRELQDMAEAGLEAAGDLEAEIHLENYAHGLTRFSEGQIHQNISMHGVYVTARMFDGRRRSEVTGAAPDSDAVVAAVRRAREDLAGGAVGPKRFLPGADSGCVRQPDEGEVPGFDPSVLGDGADWRSRETERAIEVIEREGPRPFGRVTTDFSERLIMNTCGLISYAPRTGCDVSFTAIRDTGYGYSERHASSLDDINVPEAASEAAGGCNMSRDPEPFPEGEYPVILLPYAAADLISFVARLGADGEAVSEGRSFMSGCMGERVLSDNLSVYDDGTDERGCPVLFDGEGVRKHRVDIIRDGVASDVLYDQTTGAAHGGGSTGHAPVGRAFGSIRGSVSVSPQNLFLAEGDATVGEMIEDTELGLLITTLHYTRVVEPRNVVITGMTRNGTFLVRNGSIVGPVKNLRFTDSYVRALNDVTHVGSESLRCGEGVGSVRVPALRLGGLRFTGTTDF